MSNVNRSVTFHAWIIASVVVGTCMAAAVAARSSQAPPGVLTPTAAQLASLQEEGEAVYSANCAACHGAEGVDGLGPKLAGSPSLGNKTQVIRRILEGAPTKGMPPFAPTLNDRRVAAVSTFIRTAWDNVDGPIVEAEVKKVRDEVIK
jgi:mono/diheme cytochrome c family protein